MGEKTRIELRMLKRKYKTDLQQEYQKGWREGWQEAFLDGWSEGGKQKVRYLVASLLEHRFGELNDKQLKQFRALTLEQKEDWAVALLDFTSLENLTEWLDTPPIRNLKGIILCEKSLS